MFLSSCSAAKIKKCESHFSLRAEQTPVFSRKNSTMHELTVLSWAVLRWEVSEEPKSGFGGMSCFLFSPSQRRQREIQPRGSIPSPPPMAARLCVGFFLVNGTTQCLLVVTVFASKHGGYLEKKRKISVTILATLVGVGGDGYEAA